MEKEREGEREREKNAVTQRPWWSRVAWPSQVICYLLCRRPFIGSVFSPYTYALLLHLQRPRSWRIKVGGSRLEDRGGRMVEVASLGLIKPKKNGFCLSGQGRNSSRFQQRPAKGHSSSGAHEVGRRGASCVCVSAGQKRRDGDWCGGG